MVSGFPGWLPAKKSPFHFRELFTALCSQTVVTPKGIYGNEARQMKIHQTLHINS
jgi:hypothetical protein